MVRKLECDGEATEGRAGRPGEGGGGVGGGRNSADARNKAGLHRTAVRQQVPSKQATAPARSEPGTVEQSASLLHLGICRASPFKCAKKLRDIIRGTQAGQEEHSE